MRFTLIYFLIMFLLAGCTTPSSRWRDAAFNRFNSAITAGSQQFAPEETDNIRQTLVLADRYYSRQLHEDADRLYQLSCQKSQLLYRNLVLSKVPQDQAVSVVSLPAQRHDEIVVAGAPFVRSIPETLEPAQRDTTSLSRCVSGISCDETADIEIQGGLPVFEGAAPPEHQAVQSTVHPVPPEITAKVNESVPASENMNIPSENKRTDVITPKAVRPVSSTHQNTKKTAKNSVSAKQNESGRTTIYLTFDDGPSRLTLPIATYLASQGVPATFFALGNNIKGHEKVVSDTVALGHRVGNHTRSHDLKKLNSSLQQGVSEIAATTALIDRLGGDGRLVRIPYGATSKALKSAVASEGGQIFDWDINSLDSSRRGAKDHAFIEREVMQQLQKSGKRTIVLLFHDGAGHEATLVAIRNLVPRLKQEGYRFGLLSRTDRVAQTASERRPSP